MTSTPVIPTVPFHYKAIRLRRQERGRAPSVLRVSNFEGVQLGGALRGRRGGEGGGAEEEKAEEREICEWLHLYMCAIDKLKVPRAMYRK